ncbi:ZIP family metal transporter [Candidatus Methylocalor cossyra]|uniref:Protein GufA n=1 Tax=Candidatus Methylocalor cossyra TaxID=3108543 RepID=A0ABP1CBJ4_9GAMM
MMSNPFDTLAEKLGRLPLGEKYRGLPSLGQKLILVSSITFFTSALLAFIYVFVDRTIAIGSLASILAGLATGLGALPALFVREITRKTLYTLLGGAAGVMLAATAFSLIVPGIEYGNQLWPGWGIYVVALGILAGAAFLVLADGWLPYERFLEPGERFDSLRKVWLFIAAVALHNLPEGGAVGVSFGSGDWRNGIALAIAVGLQNIPEGLAVALPLVALGYRREQAVLIATLTGLIEPIGGFLGVALVSVFLPLLPIGMAFAAGAMLFVISDDIIPETQSRGKARYATFAVMVGFIIMMILDNLMTAN